MRNLQHLTILSALLLLVTYSSAWPWPPQDLVERQNDNNANTQSTSDTQSTDTGTNTQPTNTGSNTANPTNTGSNSGTAAGTNTNAKSQSGTATDSGKGTKTTNHRTTAIDPRLPAGGVVMMTPSPLAAPSYYKVGDFVTFGWNYTSLIVSPSAINVVASCAANNEIYTLASNQSVGQTGAVTWDTGNYQSTATVPLLTETYTLIIYDVAKGISATASPGFLATFNQFTFGMYTPRPYTPLNEFKCATCSAALSDMERVTLKFLLGMTVMTVLSFTWFVNGLNLL